MMRRYRSRSEMSLSEPEEEEECLEGCYRWQCM